MHLKSQMRIQDAGEAFAFFDMEETCGNSNLVTARAAYFFRISSRIKIAQKGGENLGGAPRAPSDAQTQTHRRSSSEGPSDRMPPTGPRRLTCERVLLHAPPHAKIYVAKSGTGGITQKPSFTQKPSTSQKPSCKNHHPSIRTETKRSTSPRVCHGSAIGGAIDDDGAVLPECNSYLADV